MKKYLSVLFLFALVLVPAVSFGQVYSSTVSKVVNPVIKKYTPPVNTTAKADEPATVLKKNSKYDPLVALLQAKLTNLGTDPGPVDGVNGTKTINALKEVQRFFGLKPDGVYGKDAQKLFSILPINSSLRTTDPTVAIALKKYVKTQLASASLPTSTTSTTTNPTKLATIPFTPKGISQVLSKSLSFPGLTQTSEATISGTKLTAKPKLLTNGTKVSLYKVATSNNLNLAASSGAGLSTNFASGTGKATSVYVCGNINNTSICVPVSFEIAEAINKGTITLEQYLASKSANGNICIQCILDENGDLGVIIGGEDDGPIIPTGPNVVNAANVVDMCVDYPARGTGNVIYEITFDKAVNVMYSSGLTLDVVRYYNAPSKKITATYSGAPDGTVAGRTIRFQVPASQLSSIYYEGEGTLKSKSGAKIVVASTGQTVDLSLLTDVFRFSNTCSGSGSSYDITDTSVDLYPDKLYSGETFDSPRMDVNVKFSEPVTVAGNLKLLMNPADTGGTAVGKLVSNGSTPSDTLVFHFNSTTASWSNIFGTFGFDPGSGSVKNSSGATMLLNMPIGNDATGGHCATKRIGQPCLDLVGGEAKYTVYYDRTIEVTNAGNNSIRLKVEPLNPAAPDVIANLTSYDAHHLYFKAPATTTLVSDYTGHYWLQVDPPSKVFTVNGTLESLGHDQYGSDADPDMGVSGATCSEPEDDPIEPSELTGMCRGVGATTGDGIAVQMTVYVSFDNPVTVTNGGSGNLALQVQGANGNGVILPYISGSGTNKLTFTFTPGVPDSTPLANYTGNGKIKFKTIPSDTKVKRTGDNGPVDLSGEWDIPEDSTECLVPPSDVIVSTKCVNQELDFVHDDKMNSSWGVYGVGYSKPVTVTGQPKLEFINTIGDTVTAFFQGMIGNSGLSFKTADLEKPLSYYFGNNVSIKLNGATIKASGQNAPLSLGDFNASTEKCAVALENPLTMRQPIASMAGLCAGNDKIIEVTFKAPVSVVNSNFGLKVQHAPGYNGTEGVVYPYVSGSGTNKLTFKYTSSNPDTVPAINYHGESNKLIFWDLTTQSSSMSDVYLRVVKNEAPAKLFSVWNIPSGLLSCLPN